MRAAVIAVAALSMAALWWPAHAHAQATGASALTVKGNNAHALASPAFG